MCIRDRVCALRRSYADARWLALYSDDSGERLSAALDIMFRNRYLNDADSVARLPSLGSPVCVGNTGSGLRTSARFVGISGRLTELTVYPLSSEHRAVLTEAITVSSSLSSSGSPLEDTSPDGSQTSLVFESAGGTGVTFRGEALSISATSLTVVLQRPDTGAAAVRFSATWLLATSEGVVNGSAVGEAIYAGDAWQLRGRSTFADGSADGVGVYGGFSCQLTPNTPQLFAEVTQRTGINNGKNPLSHANLVWLGIIAAMDCTRNFAGVLQITLKWLHDSGHWKPTSTPTNSPPVNCSQSRSKKKPQVCSKHDPRGSDPQQVTEEAFAQARQRMSLEFWMMLLLILGERIQTQFENVLRWKKYRLLSLDGTLLPLPNQKALRQHYGSAKNGRSPGPVMLRMVMLNLALGRVPLAYRTSPVSTGEKTLAMQLTANLLPNDLLLLDAGFWSYGLFYQIQRQEAYFGIRLSGAFTNFKIIQPVSYTHLTLPTSDLV